MAQLIELARKVFQQLAGVQPEAEFLPVHSRSIAAIAYDPGNGVLSVEYLNGLLFEVDNVPESAFQRLLKASDMDAVYAEDILAKHRLRRVGRVMAMHPC